MRAITRAGGLALVLVAAVVGLTASGPAGAGAADQPASSPHLLVWHSCPGDPSLRCGSVAVPVNYAHPSGAQLSLAVNEKPATGNGPALGDIVVNPGGPGESGVLLLPVLAGLFPAAVTQRFNIVSFDERGTGASDRLSCGPSPATVASVVPVPSGPERPYPGTAVYTSVARQCQRAYPALLGQINSTNAARDLDRIRIALGQRRLTYYGLSYGTVLGSVYDTLYPDRVRAMVLDGAVVGTESLAAEAVQEAPALEASLHHAFATCTSADACPLAGHAEATYVRLQHSLEARPLPAPGGGDDLPVTVGDLYTASLFMVSVPSFAGEYWAALQAASAGNGAPLRAMSLDFQQDTDGSSLVGPEWTITCEDAASHPSARTIASLAWRLARRYPLAGGFAPTYDAGGCLAWPKATHPITSLKAAPGAPLLVIGNTGDPNTPHRWAASLAAALPRAHLLTWQGWGHTWLLNGTSDTCMARRVATYLTTVIPPRSGTICP